MIFILGVFLSERFFQEVMFGCRGCHSVRVAAVELTLVVVSVVVVVVVVVVVAVVVVVVVGGGGGVVGVGVVVADVPDVDLAVVVVSVVFDVLDLQAAVIVESAKNSPSWDTSTGQLRRCQERRVNCKGMGWSRRLTVRTRNK